MNIFHKEAETFAQAGYEVVLIAQNDKDKMEDTSDLSIKGNIGWRIC